MSNYAHYCLQKLKILPSTFLNMDEQEMAFVIASIQVRVEAEMKENKKLKRKGKH